MGNEDCEGELRGCVALRGPAAVGKLLRILSGLVPEIHDASTDQLDRPNNSAVRVLDGPLLNCAASIGLTHHSVRPSHQNATTSLHGRHHLTPGESTGSAPS